MSIVVANLSVASFFSAAPCCCKVYGLGLPLRFILECLSRIISSTNSIAPTSGLNDFGFTIDVNGIRAATVSVLLELRDLVWGIAARTGYWPGTGGLLA